MIPVWLLDVDGVINAAVLKPNTSAWPRDEWIATKVVADDCPYPFMVARPVLDLIREVHAGGFAEIRWHTTWRHDTLALEAALDLPHLAVQEAPEFARRGSGRWWKLPAVERVLMHECRDLLWTDDDITWELRSGHPARTDGVIELLRQVARIELISPDTQTGLCQRHIRKIREFLNMEEAP